MVESAVYVYGVVKSANEPSTRRAPAGLPGATPPDALALSRSLWAIVADVPLSQYGPGPLDATLRDMDRVGAVALAHEAVVEHFARSAGATMVPAKLFTMFSSRARARQDMLQRRGEIAAAAKRIAGCDEWGVRIMRRQPEAPSAGPRAATGTDFLAAKKRARDAKIASDRAAAAVASEAYDGLTRLSRAARRRDDVPDGAAAPPLLDAAFLVARGGRARFKAAVRRAARSCASAGATLMLSGPWPAYNFIEAVEAR